ncbi:MAG: YSC84-related protein [Candidatus Deferrimicrobiaceae bacterium]|jgi:lipid-binding SYLF domain-containing protein
MKSQVPAIDRLRLAAISFSVLLVLLLGILLPGGAHAATAREIDVSVNVALERFTKEIKGSKELLAIAKGVLVFPSVYKAGLVVGGEYGEGALRIGGKTVDYYNTVAGSFGLQIGAQSKTIIIVFIQQEALDKFRKSEGWKAGVDGSVALISVGVGGALDTENIKDPIVGFAFGQKGLMANLTFEGAKITRVNVEK